MFFLSCQKNDEYIDLHTNATENMYFQLYDSIVQLNNLGTIISETHHAIDKNIEMKHLIYDDEILFLSDTFRRYTSTTDSFYIPKNGTFPLLFFSDTSIRIVRHLGGVSMKTWSFVDGRKK